MDDLRTLIKWPSYSQKEERGKRNQEVSRVAVKLTLGEVIPTYISFLMRPPEEAMWGKHLNLVFKEGKEQVPITATRRVDECQEQKYGMTLFLSDILYSQKKHLRKFSRGLHKRMGVYVCVFTL